MNELSQKSLLASLTKWGYEQTETVFNFFSNDNSLDSSCYLEDGRISPRTFDMCDQPAQWLYDEDFTSIVLDREVFPNEFSFKELSELIFQLNWNDIMEAVYVGVHHYIEETYGKDWQELYPE